MDATPAPSHIIHTVTEDNLQELLARRAPVVLDFWADWCQPCRSFAPVFEAAASRHTDMVFGKIDIDRQPALAEDFRIRSVPTLMIIREQILVHRASGALTATELLQILEQARLIDMDDLRAELAAAEGDLDAIDH